MITVWGRASSSNVQKVVWTLDELGVPFERIDLGREFGGLDTDDYLGMNPNGRIPTVKDGDVILWESQAICRYLCRTYEGAALLPEDPAAAAHVEKWMDWNIAHLAPSVFPMFLQAREANDIAVARDARFEKLVAEAQKNLAILNDALAGQDYLCGDAFTLADLTVSVSLSRWAFVGFDLSGFDALAAWEARVGERPACRQHNVVTF
ncbi:MAG: glutathione S-transferase family protein [Pseudomonadota bacterium]